MGASNAKFHILSQNLIQTTGQSNSLDKSDSALAPPIKLWHPNVMLPIFAAKKLLSLAPAHGWLRNNKREKAKPTQPGVAKQELVVYCEMWKFSSVSLSLSLSITDSGTAWNSSQKDQKVWTILPAVQNPHTHEETKT